MAPNDIDIPADFFCPITGEIMHDPLMSRYGGNFERSAIVHWLQYHSNTCPLTRNILGPRDLVPNVALKFRIQAFCSVNKIDLAQPKETPEQGNVVNDWMPTVPVETLTKAKDSTPSARSAKGLQQGASRKKPSFLSRIVRFHCS